MATHAGAPPRQETISSVLSDDAVPDTDPSTVRTGQRMGLVRLFLFLFLTLLL